MTVTYNQGDELVWHDYFKVHEEKVDEQHSRIVVLINSLIEACKRGDAQEQLGDALYFLANYVVEHFNYEEYLMDEYDLPGKEQHKAIHDEFKQTAGTLVKQYDTNGASDELCETLTNVVCCWLVTHITNEDIKTFENLHL